MIDYHDIANMVECFTVDPDSSPEQEQIDRGYKDLAGILATNCKPSRQLLITLDTLLTSRDRAIRSLNAVSGKAPYARRAVAEAKVVPLSPLEDDQALTAAVEVSMSGLQDGPVVDPLASPLCQAIHRRHGRCIKTEHAITELHEGERAGVWFG